MNKIFALIGPTASGKTELGIKIAEFFNCEIISIDSTMIYKKLNIGSDKPTPFQMQSIKHHNIDIIDPWINNYSVKDFLVTTKSLIYEIFCDIIWYFGFFATT